MSPGVVLLLALLSTTLTGALAQGFNYVASPWSSPTTCVTPQGEQGECVLLKDCPHLFNIFRQSRTFETRQQLERLTCGYEQRYAKICCADNEISGPSNPRPPPRPTPRPTPRPVARPTPRPTPGLPPKPLATVGPVVSMLPLVDEQSSGSDQENLLQHRNIGLLPLDTCGIVFKTKIYGGNDTTLGEFPWAALLEYEKDGKRSFQCGGALISKRYVLTAAHCSNQGTIGMNRLVGVRLGEHDTTKNPDCEPDAICKLSGRANCPMECADEPLNFSIEEEVVHPQYRSTNRNQYNDIALLRLSSDVRFSDYVMPICIPTNANLVRKIYVGSNLTATGWGRTTAGTKSPVMLKADLPGVSLDECVATYARNRRNVTSMQLCAGGVPGVDVCSGDSGGPLMTLENVELRYHVTGIVSYGSNMCHFGVPGVYTKVAAYARWILDQLRP